MAMKRCKECGEEMSASANVCPKCGKDQRNFFMKHKVITFILAIIIIAVIGSMGSSNDTNTTSTGENNNIGTNTQTITEKFTVLDHTTENDGYGTYITGTVKNNTDKEYTYVGVEINLYDEDGTMIGTASDFISNLEANGTWKFKAITTDEFATYKIKEVSGW